MMFQHLSLKELRSEYDDAKTNYVRTQNPAFRVFMDILGEELDRRLQLISNKE